MLVGNLVRQNPLTGTLLENKSNGNWLKRYSIEEIDWEEYLPNQFRLIITQQSHRFINAYVDYMEIYNTDEGCWENNLSAVQKRLANDSIVIYSDKPVRCNLTIEGER